MDEQPIVHEADSHRFSVTVDGHLAVLEYRAVRDGVLDYYRTFVPPEIRHRGVALKLARHALAYAANNDLEVIPSCWFVAKVIRESQA